MRHTEAGPDSLAVRAGRAFAAYRSGRAEEMNELVDLLNPVLWHTARGQGLGMAAAEDAVQTAWLRLVESADRIGDPQAVMQWLIVTVKRESWKVGKQGQKQVPAADLDVDRPSPSPAPDALAVLSEGQRVLWGHLRSLTPRCQALLRLVAFTDRPDYAAVSQALGMPVGSIGPTRGRCLAKLREALQADPVWGGAS